MVFKDYYAILKCDINSTDEEIKKRYHKLALKYHPDKNNGDKKAEEKLKDINEAYNTLKDKTLKTQYDKIYYKEKNKTSLTKRSYSDIAKVQKIDITDIPDIIKSIAIILFAVACIGILVIECINNNLTFYKYFYNTDFNFKKKCFINLLKTFFYIYTILISFVPTYILIYNIVRQLIGFGTVAKEDYIEDIIASIIISATFFLSLYENIRFIVVIVLYIIGNVYIIREKIWKKYYSFTLLILMYILFIPETFLQRRSHRKYEICDGRIWCQGERMDEYYKNKTQNKNQLKNKMKI